MKYINCGGMPLFRLSSLVIRLIPLVTTFLKPLDVHAIPIYVPTIKINSIFEPVSVCMCVFLGYSSASDA